MTFPPVRNATAAESPTVDQLVDAVRNAERDELLRLVCEYGRCIRQELEYKELARTFPNEAGAHMRDAKSARDMQGELYTAIKELSA